MHYPDSRWRPRCQKKSRDDVSGRINIFCKSFYLFFIRKFVTSYHKSESHVVHPTEAVQFLT